MDALIYFHWCTQVEFFMSQNRNPAPFMDMMLLESSLDVVMSVVLVLMFPGKLMRFPPDTSVVLFGFSF